MSPALNGRSAIRHFKHSDAIEIRDGITFDFYTGLPHIRKLIFTSRAFYTRIVSWGEREQRPIRQAAELVGNFPKASLPSTV